MLGWRVTVVAGIAAAALPGLSLAQDGGAYVAVELGRLAAPGLRLDGADNDWSTRCDLLINPVGAETNGECEQAPSRTSWFNEIDGADGVLAAVAAGYAWRRLRVEAEYLGRHSVYDRRAPTVIGDSVTLGKADQEIEIADGGVGDVFARHLFANLSYDFPVGSRLRGFVGAGAGVAWMSLDYFSRWKRNDDPAAIKTFRDPALRAKIAGTTTLAAARLSDILTGHQLFVGANYRPRGRVTFGLRVRRAGFAPFESADNEWLQLRSHESTVGRGFQVVYSVETTATSFWAASLFARWRI